MDNDSSAIIEVAVEAGSWSRAVTHVELFCERIVEAALQAGDGLPAARVEVSVLLTDDAAMRGLNKRYRGQDKPTNVLSFPGHDEDTPVADGPILLGDIVLAYQTIEREAGEQAKPFVDHMAHLLVHGSLHLLGFDHDNDDDATIMEQTETRIMTELGYPDPYDTQGEAV